MESGCEGQIGNILHSNGMEEQTLCQPVMFTSKWEMAWILETSKCDSKGKPQKWRKHGVKYEEHNRLKRTIAEILINF